MTDSQSGPERPQAGVAALDLDFAACLKSVGVPSQIRDARPARWLVPRAPYPDLAAVFSAAPAAPATGDLSAYGGIAIVAGATGLSAALAGNDAGVSTHELRLRLIGAAFVGLAEAPNASACLLMVQSGDRDRARFLRTAAALATAAAPAGGATDADHELYGLAVDLFVARLQAAGALTGGPSATYPRHPTIKQICRGSGRCKVV